MGNFDNILAAFAQSGKRYAQLPKLTASGKASGMTAGEIIERVRAVGVTDRDADIRRLWNGSKAEPNRRSSTWRPTRPSVPTLTPQERTEDRRRNLSKEARNFAPITLRDYATTTRERRITADILGETIRLSDADLHLNDDFYRSQAARQLRALFYPGEKIWAGAIIQDEVVRTRLGIRHAKSPITPSPGDNLFDPSIRAGIIEAHVLAERIENGMVSKIPTHISLQPVIGKSAQTSASLYSFDCAATISTYRHAMIEWDDLFDKDADGMKTPSQTHIDIVAGLLNYYFENPNRFRPVCAVYTGGKSIHLALRVKADDLAAYKQQTQYLADIFASADDKNFRADDQTGWTNGYTHIRLAGAIRPENGRRARLLWCNQ